MQLKIIFVILLLPLAIMGQSKKQLVDSLKKLQVEISYQQEKLKRETTRLVEIQAQKKRLIEANTSLRFETQQRLEKLSETLNQCKLLEEKVKSISKKQGELIDSVKIAALNLYQNTLLVSTTITNSNNLINFCLKVETDQSLSEKSLNEWITKEISTYQENQRKIQEAYQRGLAEAEEEERRRRNSGSGSGGWTLWGGFWW